MRAETHSSLSPVSAIEDQEDSLVNNRGQDPDENDGCPFDPLRTAYTLGRKDRQPNEGVRIVEA